MCDENKSGDCANYLGTNITVNVETGNKAKHEWNAHSTKMNTSGLLITKNIHRQTPLFADEIRAKADIIHFGMNSSLLLNNTCVSVEEIVTSLLNEMFKENIFKNKNRETLVSKAFQALFIHNNKDDNGFLQFAKTIQGFENQINGTLDVNTSWLICMAPMSHIDKRIVGITTMMQPVNMGNSQGGVQIMAIVLTPNKEKHTKCDIETSRSIAAVLANLEFRQEIHMKYITKMVFREKFLETAKHFINLDSNDTLKPINISETESISKFKYLGQGILRDFCNRFRHYGSDYKDAWRDKNSILKTISSIFFLFFASLLPTIAFGMLNETNTNNKINVSSGLMAQLIGGIGFGLFGGQHLTVILTGAPLSLITMVIFKLSINFDFNFFSFYAWVGVFNTIYLWIYAVTGLGKIVKYSRKSTEETFAFFVAIAYIQYAVAALITSFTQVGISTTKEESMLFLLLLLGTASLAMWLHQYTNSAFLNSFLRKLLAGFALPIAVLVTSTARSTIFTNIKMHNFNVSTWQNTQLHFARLNHLPRYGVLGAAGLGIPISILFFMGHNISSSIVNCPSNKLKKGSSYNWDLIVIGFLNLILSLFGLPWLYGAPLHSSLHIQSLATIEERVSPSHDITQRVVKVVETRLSSITGNIMVGACIFMMPYPLLYLSSPVLYGLFLYIALRSLQNNQLFQRILLIFTEQTAYPPNHYLKRVPQRIVHIFTFIQSLQVIALCIIGFSPFAYIRIIFPIILIIQLPFRHIMLPRFISIKYLNALDNVH